MRIGDSPLGVGLPLPPIQRKPPVIVEPAPLAAPAPPPGQGAGPGPSREITAMLAAQLANFDARQTPASFAACVYTAVSKLK